MSAKWYDAVLQLREPMEPIPTEVASQLDQIAPIDAVIFDIYGTLVISGSGDVGSADQSDRGDHIGDAIAAVGIDLGSGRTPSIDDLHQTIGTLNRKRAEDGCIKPEVDIVEVWRIVLRRCEISRPSTEAVHRLAAEYEARANPTWPMPGAKQLLEHLAQSEKRMGIVSNAQGFTLPLVEELAGGFGGDSVFDANLCVFSYRYRQAKPAPRMFDVLCDGLNRAGIDPARAIYVGNDRLNDIWAASQAGLRTAWFAGDRRSLRPRANDARAAGVQPDLILTQLDQLIDCI